MKAKRFPFLSESFVVLILSILLVAFATSPLFAQIDRAVLEGTVIDPSGRVVAGATVRVVAVDT